MTYNILRRRDFAGGLKDAALVPAILEDLRADGWTLLRGYSDALRRELAPQGVAVTYLAPRGLRTAAADGFAGLVAPMGMALDDPEAAARRAWRAIAARRASQYPKTRERFFVALQRVRPMLIDRALSKMAGDPEVIAAARGKW